MESMSERTINATRCRGRCYGRCDGSGGRHWRAWPELLVLVNGRGERVVGRFAAETL
jgi:hypothetical protein